MIELNLKEIKFLYKYQLLCKDLKFTIKDNKCYMTNQKDYDFLKQLQIAAKNI